jgi:hypothetical protein
LKTSQAIPFLVLALVALSCGVESPAPVETRADDGPPPIPGSAEVCFAAMDGMEFPSGSTMIGVEELEGGCAVSVRFTNDADAEEFLRQRRDSGLSTVSVPFVGSDGTAVEIPLQVQVRDRTVNLQ